jgi:hypothetical protein
MERLEFLNKAIKYAQQQVSDSACMGGEEFEDIKISIENGQREESALKEQAKRLLEEAVFDIDL